ncbi:MAG TPA: CoA ester lyase [Chloroflexota bacterium]
MQPSRLPPLRSWLYAPGNSSRLLERVFDVGADAVIVDLEDAVPHQEKGRARAMAAEAVRTRVGLGGPVVFVRINHPETGLAEQDIQHVVGPGLDGLRLPKTDSAATVARVDAWITAAETRAGLALGSIALVCNIESAAGVWRAAEIAMARPRVLALAFGGVDFGRDVGASVGPEGLETLHARSHLVLASRVAGIRSPVEGVYTQLHDLDGLEHTTRQSRALGMFGRSAIHPRQVPVINRVFTPSEDDLAWARGIVEAARDAERSSGTGAFQLPGGEFVDVAVVRRAEALLQLADRLAGGVA